MEDLPVECQEHILAQIVENENLRVTCLVSKRFYTLSRQALGKIKLDTRQGVGRLSQSWISPNVVTINFFCPEASEGGTQDRTAFWADIAAAMPKLAYLDLCPFQKEAVKEAEIAIPLFPALKGLRLPAQPQEALLRLIGSHCPLLEQLEMESPADEPRPQITQELEDAYIALAQRCPRLRTCSPLSLDLCADETPLLEKMLSSLPHLQSTIIQPMPRPGSRLREVSTRLCSFGPQMKSLDLSFVQGRLSPDLEGFHFYLSCSELESLKLPVDTIQERQLAYVFAVFPKLRNLIVPHFVVQQGPHDMGFSSSLKSLSIGLDHHQWLASIDADTLDELARTLPSLTTLELKGRHVSIDASEFVLPRALQHLKLERLAIKGFLGTLEWGSLKSLSLDKVVFECDLQDACFPAMEKIDFVRNVKFHLPHSLTFEKAADIWPNMQRANFSGTDLFSLMEPNPVGTALHYLKVGAVNGTELQHLSQLLTLKELDLCLADYPIGTLERGLSLVLKMAKVGNLRSLLLNVAKFPRTREFLIGLRKVLAQAPSHLQLERDTWVSSSKPAETPRIEEARGSGSIFG